ncbi:hypothetical protein OPQ81_000693 [Rhizoctonia solani]|nr:hypothetical protein OPQ81_000693 [Rhizoctonia solani]
MAIARVDWGEFEYDGQNLLFSGHARMPPEQLPGFLLTADGDDRPHAWWVAQTKLYDLRTSGNPTVREMRDLLAQAIRHNRLVVPDVLREAEHNAAELMRLYTLREAFTRRNRDPPPGVTTSHPTPAVSPTTPSRTSSPRPTQSSPGAMSLQNMPWMKTQNRDHPTRSTSSQTRKRAAQQQRRRQTRNLTVPRNGAARPELTRLRHACAPPVQGLTVPSGAAVPMVPRLSAMPVALNGPSRAEPAGDEAEEHKQAQAPSGGERPLVPMYTRLLQGLARPTLSKGPPPPLWLQPPVFQPPILRLSHPPSPSTLVGTNTPITSVPPNPRSPAGSHSPDVKVETDAASGLMDLANVAALESGRTEPRSAVEPARNGTDSREEPQPSQSLKRPRADSSYNGIGRPYDRPPSSRTPSSTRGYPDSYPERSFEKGTYPESAKPYSESTSRPPYSDSSRAYSSSGSEGAGGGVRPINVIPIGNYRD